MLGKAHLSWPGQSNNASQPPTSFGGQYDDMSRTCLACHDGLISRDISTASTQLNGMSGGEHPVGVAVMGSVGDSRIRLVDGRVGCTTCHSPFSREEKLLVMSNRYSKLCLSCHRM